MKPTFRKAAGSHASRSGIEHARLSHRPQQRDWRNQITNVRDWHNGDLGRDWWHQDRGFYSGDNFWFGFQLGEAASWDWNNQPVYIVSPVTGDPCGELTPPGDGGFSDPNAAYEQVLNVMASPGSGSQRPQLRPHGRAVRRHQSLASTRRIPASRCRAETPSRP